MAEQDPSVEELQKTVTQLTAERDKLQTDLKAAQSYKTQFDELKVKYDSVVQTNMDLIRHIPMDDDHDQAKTGNCRIFSGEDPVDLLTSDPCLTFSGFYYCLLT